MLVITRKAGKSFYIGKDIEIVILDARGNVRIGINAPESIPILRDEHIKKDALRAKQIMDDATIN